MAAGLGLAAAKKLGLLAVILAFGKKFIVFVLAGAAAVGRWFSSIFGGKTRKKALPPAVFPASGGADAGSADSAVQQPADKQDPTVK